METKECSWFVVISYEILTSKELTDKEKLLIGLISSLQGERGYCYANNKYMSDRLNCTPDTVKDLISNLVKLKWLQRKIYRNENNEFVKRILTIKMTKKPSEFDEIEAENEPDPLRGNFHPPPPGKIPPTSVVKSPLLIDNINKEEEIAKTEKIETLPTLEEITKISNEVYKDKFWLEQVCMATSTKMTDLVKWMRVFNLHLSSTEEIHNLNSRRYRVIFLGWIRKKAAAGVRLADFTMDNTTTNQKQSSAPPLTRL